MSVSATLGSGRRRRVLVVAGQLVAFAIFAVCATWAIGGNVRGAWHRIQDASLVDFGLGCAAVAAYYLLFVIGWIRILGAWGVRMSYGAALRAEMVSMLAKYIPGGVWTPAARVVAARRAGVRDAALVTTSILVEAGVSAVAGVIVFVVSLATVHDVDAPILPLLAFAAVMVLLLHPRVFQPIAGRLVRRFGGHELAPLPARTLLGLLGFYCCTWVVGGGGLYFFIRAVGGAPPLHTIGFLGGVGAVGAIVAVASVFAPSGLGPREASMYGLLLAVTSPSVALGATVLNRLAITLVEVLLLVAGATLLRRGDSRDVG